MIQKESLIEIAEKYIEIANQIKKLEEEKEKLREKLINSEKEKIKTENGIIRVLTKKNAILNDEKIIFTLSKQELTKVATISVSKFRKLAENKFNIDDFIIDYKEVKEVKIILPDK
jgi:DNA-binding protein H-NS